MINCCNITIPENAPCCDVDHKGLNSLTFTEHNFNEVYPEINFNEFLSTVKKDLDLSISLESIMDCPYTHLIRIETNIRKAIFKVVVK